MTEVFLCNLAMADFIFVATLPFLLGFHFCSNFNLVASTNSTYRESVKVIMRADKRPHPCFFVILFSAFWAAKFSRDCYTCQCTTPLTLSVTVLKLKYHCDDGQKYVN